MPQSRGHSEAKPGVIQPDDGGNPFPPAASALATHIVDEDRFDADLATRLRMACRGETAAMVAAKVGMNREAVRRTLQTGRTPAKFLQGLCREYGANAHWLVTGEGAPTSAGAPGWFLRAARTEDLLAEVARRLGRLLELVERADGGAPGCGERPDAQPGG